MRLTDTKARTAKAADKPYKLFDGSGLYLEVTPSGGKWWRWKYRRDGKENRLSLGVYPEVSLKDARDRCAEERKRHAAGVDPSAHRKAAKLASAEAAANSFESIAREWLAVKARDWTPRQHEKERDRLENHAFPWIGRRPVASLGVADIRPLLKRVEERGHIEQVRRLRGQLDRVFRFAIASERAEKNPAAALVDTMPRKQGTNFPTITDPAEVAKLLRAIDAFTGTLPVASALKLLPLLFTRPGELRAAEWAHIDLHDKAPTLKVPPANRKLRKAEKESARTPPHVVPLSTQAVAILRDLHPLTGRGRYVFPNARHSDRPMSDGAVNAALATIGFKDTIVGHGFRHMASTLLHEQGWRGDAIEHQLSHKTPGVRGVYNKAEHLPERAKMMQAWADYLDGLKTGGNVVPLNRKIG